MKKLKFFPAVLALGLFISSCGDGGTSQKADDTAKADDKKQEESHEPVTMTANTDDSRVQWAGTLVGVYTHQGYVPVKAGELTLEGKKVTGGEFTIDLSTIVPTDDNYKPEEGKSKEKLAGHLKDEDFFYVEEFPTAHFRITGHNAETNEIMGVATIRGVEGEETITNVKINPKTGEAKGKLTFDRQKYDVAFSHPAEDMVLSDDIELEISLKMNPKS